MLVLIGYGLDPRDLGQRALEAARQCDVLYAEFYTNVTQEPLALLEQVIGKPVRERTRADMEDGSAKLVAEAKEHAVALLVPGDPLAATTHSALVLEARKAEVAVRVLHNASVFSAIGEIGLQLYKFGRAVTLATPYKGAEVTGWYAEVLANKERGLHTLLLLDSGTGGAPMSVQEALELLLRAEHKERKGLFTPGTRLVVASRLGLEGGVSRYGAIEELAPQQFLLPAVLVLPGKLHFVEEELLGAL